MSSDMSPDQIIRAAERYIGNGYPMPQSLIEIVLNEHPCSECANRPIPPDVAYSRDVAEVAQELAQAVNDGEVENREELEQRLWETVDGHQRVIYTNQAIETLRYSNNDGYSIDNFGVEGIVENGAINWSRLAFGAFYADIIEHPDAPDWNNPFTCEDCGNQYENLQEFQECCLPVFECPSCEEEHDTEKEAQECCE
jgi:hypothetical protein